MACCYLCISLKICSRLIVFRFCYCAAKKSRNVFARFFSKYTSIPRSLETVLHGTFHFDNFESQPLLHCPKPPLYLLVLNIHFRCLNKIEKRLNHNTIPSIKIGKCTIFCKQFAGWNAARARVSSNVATSSNKS